MRKLFVVLSAAVLFAAFPAGFSAGAAETASSGISTTSLMDDAEDCLEAVPAAFSLDYLTGDDEITLEVDVLLDGMSLEDGAEKFERAQQAYSPLDIRLVPRYTEVDFDPSGSEAGVAFVTRDDLFEQAKAHFGGERPFDSDVVYTLTTMDIHGASGGSTAGVADCIGGIRYPNRAFAIGQYDPAERLPDTAKIAAHEIGHLLGAHHHYTNCAEGVPAGVNENMNEGISGGFCTTMFPDIFFVSLSFGTFEAGVVRGHAEAWADETPAAGSQRPASSPSPTSSPRPSGSPSSSSSPRPAASSSPAPRVEHVRTVSLSLRRHVVARGLIEASSDAPRSCLDRVEVQILRRSPSGWAPVATTTSLDGAFRVRLPDRHGRYAASIETANVDPNTGCSGARSRVVRHRHR